MICACGREMWGRWKRCHECRKVPCNGKPTLCATPKAEGKEPVKADAQWERIRRATDGERERIEYELWGNREPRNDTSPHYVTRRERLRLERKTPHDKPTFDHEAIADMLTEGRLSTREIACQFGCSRNLVQKIRTRMNRESGAEGRAA